MRREREERRGDTTASTSSARARRAWRCSGGSRSCASFTPSPSVTLSRHAISDTVISCPARRCKKPHPGKHDVCTKSVDNRLTQNY